jgi:ribosomal-protein-alanine N-acetyltransferase
MASDFDVSFELVPCDEAGTPVRSVGEMSPSLRDLCSASAGLYANIGFEPPWISYIAVSQGTPVGGGAFVGKPKDGFVEIAYFTLDEFQSRGFAGRTAGSLVQIARLTAPDVTITAKTLRERNPSVKVLERLGFRQIRDVMDDDAGLVWEWHLPPE